MRSTRLPTCARWMAYSKLSYRLPLLYLQIRDLTGTGEVTKKRLREGEGQFPVDCPVEDCPVQVHIRCGMCVADRLTDSSTREAPN